MIQPTIAELGLTVESVFIPFSQSRNKSEKNKTLNWNVTLWCNGRPVMSFDYSAGIAHCPSYSKKPPAAFDRRDRFWPEMAAGYECESGFALGPSYSWSQFRPDRAKPIRPNSVSVIYALVMDSAVLFCDAFEQWATEYGYDTDSRKAELIYRNCLDQSLRLKAAIGMGGIEKLQTAYQDY